MTRTPPLAQPYQAICWDHDGLLVDTESLFYSATSGVLAEVGVELPRTLWSREYLSRGAHTAELMAELGVPEERRDVLIQERNRRYRVALEAGPSLCPGVLEALQFARARLPMALVTGSRREAIEIVHRRTGLLELFSTVVAQEDCPRSKPFPDLYLEASRRLKVTPARCLAVEDSERGLAAARAAGMECAAVPGPVTLGQKFEGALGVFASIADVLRTVFPDFAPGRGDRLS